MAQLLVLALLGLPACGATNPNEGPAGEPASGAPSVEGVRPAPAISSADARHLVAAGAVLLDVRSPGEFALRHLEGATNIPVSELEERSSELDADLPVVVYCMSGHRSEHAGRLLRAKGFTYVFDLGAMTAY